MARTTALVAVGTLVLASAGLLLADGDYTVDVVMSSATNLVPGSAVQIDGQKVGTVERLAPRDGRAVVTVSLDDEHAPLHDGTTARISWKATLGERILELQPGPAGNAALPEGALIEGAVDRVELDQVLAALDPPTRARLQELLAHLDSTLTGSENDLQRTLSTAGPALLMLGEVLRAVGDDGPAIRSLVTRLRKLTEAASSRRQAIGSTIDQLASSVDTVAARREELRAVLRELPTTMDTANRTLGKVPGTVDAALPLLQDLRPATARLPRVSRQLNPVLRDLQPTVAELRWTLAALEALMREAPGLLAELESVAPQVDMAGRDLAPVLRHLRPYTPELAGWLSNWGSAAANYDADGHYLRAFVQEGGASLNHNPGVLPPGVERKTSRLPGEAEGQPWTDAHGSELR